MDQKLTGQKFDGDKPRMDLLPTAPLVEIAKVLGFGAKKYAAHNWRGGIEYSRLIGSAYRHLAAFNDGEDLDPESGLSHLAHLGCCVVFLLEQFKKGTGLDDRYKGSSSEDGAQDEVTMEVSTTREVAAATREAPDPVMFVWGEPEGPIEDE